MENSTPCGRKDVIDQYPLLRLLKKQEGLLSPSRQRTYRKCLHWTKMVSILYFTVHINMIALARFFGHAYIMNLF
jgi:hypothetical protein